MVLVNWLFTFPLILAAGAWHEIGRGIITDQGLDSKDERVGKRLDVGDKRNMAGHANDPDSDEQQEVIEVQILPQVSQPSCICHTQ